MKLELQVDKLSALGLPLNPGISIDDLLLSFPRDEYEATPFDLILFAYGMEVESEPWGRHVCDRAWNFDVECIEDHGDYAAIVDQFHRISGREKTLTDLSDVVDLESGRAELRYTVDGTPRVLSPQVDDDWVDPDVAAQIMEDMRGSTHDFYGKDNGQATVWFYLTPDNATELNGLAGTVFGLRKPWWKFW